MKIRTVEAIPVWYEPTHAYHALFGSGRYADMVSLKLGKCGGLYKAVQMMRIAEAAGLPVRIDWTQGSALLDTATGHLHATVRLVGCDPGMDYQLRIRDKPVAEGGARVEGSRLVMPDGPGLGLRSTRHWSGGYPSDDPDLGAGVPAREPSHS